MQSNLLTSFVLTLFITLISCSTGAPELPTDYSSIHSTQNIDESMFAHKDLKYSCDDIFRENEKLKEQRFNINKSIEESRAGDQAAVFLLGIGAMLLDTNGDVKEMKKQIQGRLDTLNLLRRYKKC